jgi:hypothetical protein
MKKIKKLSLYKTVVSNLTPDETNQLRGGSNYSVACTVAECVSLRCGSGTPAPYTGVGSGPTVGNTQSILNCNTNDTICITRVCNPTYTK